MSQQDAHRLNHVGLFLNPVGQRRVDFQSLCGEQFGRLFLADGAGQAGLFLAQQSIDLLVIDLERFERSFDLAAIGALISQRAGARTIVICPCTNAGWLPELMAFGVLEYAIGPLQERDLYALVAAQLTPASGAAQPDPSRLRALLTSSARLQQAISEVDDLDRIPGQICVALATLPGVVHASLFQLREAGDLQLEAQHSDCGVTLSGILDRSDRLAQSPLRHAFPGLLAACGGEMALLDAPGKAGEPELAMNLAGSGVEMVLGLPLPASRAGVSGGALCLMFEHARQFSSDEIAALTNLAQLAGFGLRMAAMSRENEQLRGQLTHLATTDALTKVANRRHGEYLLELEVRRSLRFKLPMSLIVFNIDRFKAINDQYGHAVGDVVIRSVAEATQGALRHSDVLVRSGGEQFHIIAPHTSAIDALKMAEKIRMTVAQTEVPGCDRVTISLGAGQLGVQDSPGGLTVRVETALSRAKGAGRNCVELAML